MIASPIAKANAPIPFNLLTFRENMAKEATGPVLEYLANDKGSDCPSRTPQLSKIREASMETATAACADTVSCMNTAVMMVEVEDLSSKTIHLHNLLVRSDHHKKARKLTAETKTRELARRLKVLYHSNLRQREPRCNGSGLSPADECLRLGVPGALERRRDPKVSDSNKPFVKDIALFNRAARYVVFGRLSGRDIETKI